MTQSKPEARVADPPETPAEPARLVPRVEPAEPDRVTKIWRLRVLVLVVAIAAGALTFGVSKFIAPTYRSTATIRVSGQPVNGALSDAATASNTLAQQYAEIVTTGAVLGDAARRLQISPSKLSGSVSAGTVNAQNLVDVSAEARTAAEATRRASAVARAFIAYITVANRRQAKRLVRALGGGGRSVPSLAVEQGSAAAQPDVEPAGVTPAETPVAPKPPLYAAIAFLVGGLAAAQLIGLSRRQRQS